MKILIVIGVVLAAVLVIGRCGGDGSQTEALTLASDAEKVAEALNRTDERIRCEAKANAKTIMCLVHTSDSELGRVDNYASASQTAAMQIVAA